MREIGLAAKVSPELDEGETEEQAGKLRNQMENSLEGLRSSVDVEEVSQRAKEMEETAQQASGGDDEEGGYGGGMTGRIVQKLDAVTAANLKQVAFIRSISGGLSQIGQGLLEGGGKLAIGGLALVMLGRIVDNVKQASPFLGQILDMFSMAFSLFFRPIGRKLGQWLLPIATGMLQLAANFNQVFGNQGLLAALAWLATEIVSGIANFGLQLILGEDMSLGLADIIRGAIQGGALVAGLRGGILRAFIQALPNITGARIIGAMTFPGIGRIVSRVLTNRFGVEALEMTLSQIIKRGMTGLARKIVPQSVRAFATRIASALGGKSIISLIRSLVGRVGGSALVQGLISRLPSIGIRAFLGRVLPSIGVRAFLSRIGIAGIVRALSGRLAYLIPVVGQLIGIIDLLTFIITALIPGMEAFSPIMWTLTQVFNLLKGAVMGLYNFIMNMIGGGSLFGGGGGGGIISAITGITDTIMTFLIPLLEPLKLAMALLAPFAIIGIELFNLLLGVNWGGLSGTLSDISNSISDFASDPIGTSMDIGSSIADFAWSNYIDYLDWLEGGFVSALNWTQGIVPTLSWSSFVNVLSWLADGYVSYLNWLGDGIVSILNWTDGNIISMLTWGNFVNALSWLADGYVSILEWQADGIISVLEWTGDNIVSALTWTNFVNVLSWLADGYVSILSWTGDGIVSVLSWTEDGIVSVLDWTEDNIVSMLTWSTFLNVLEWGVDGYVSAINWSQDFINTLGSEVWTSVIEAPNWSEIFDDAQSAATSSDIPGGSTGDSIVGAYAVTNPLIEQDDDGGVSMADWYGAEGGIVTGPTLGMIGEGAENEAVLPLSHLSSMMSTPSVSGPSVDADTTASVDVGGGNEAEIASEIEAQLGSTLENVSAELSEIASAISNAGGGQFQITADGKVLAEVASDGEDRYRRTMEVNR